MKLSTVNQPISVSKGLAPEDICRGDFVAVLSRICEYPVWYAGEEVWGQCTEEPLLVRWRSLDSGIPLKVLDVCLPFVFVSDPLKSHQSIDLRLTQLARLKPSYAKRVRKALRRELKKCLGKCGPYGRA